MRRKKNIVGKNMEKKINFQNSFTVLLLLYFFVSESIADNLLFSVVPSYVCGIYFGKS